jgi:hypothetical protein
MLTVEDLYLHETSARLTLAKFFLISEKTTRTVMQNSGQGCERTKFCRGRFGAKPADSADSRMDDVARRMKLWMSAEIESLVRTKLSTRGTRLRTNHNKPPFEKQEA